MRSNAFQIIWVPKGKSFVQTKTSDKYQYRAKKSWLCIKSWYHDFIAFFFFCENDAQNRLAEITRKKNWNFWSCLGLLWHYWLQNVKKCFIFEKQESHGKVIYFFSAVYSVIIFELYKYYKFESSLWVLNHCSMNWYLTWTIQLNNAESVLTLNANNGSKLTSLSWLMTRAYLFFLCLSFHL